MIPIPPAVAAWAASAWVRAGLALALVAGVALMGWRVSAWHASHEALPGLQAALEARLEAQSAEVLRGYEDEVAELLARPVRSRVVRVCPDPGAGGLRGAATASAAHAAGAPAGVLPGAPGRDIGPELYELARDADEVSARLRALQGWNESLLVD